MKSDTPTPVDAYSQLSLLSAERFSCRAYAPRAVSREVILKIMEIVRLAPSACNRQPWKFLVADTESLRRAVVESYPREWMATAPTFIVVCGLHSEAWRRGLDGKDHTDIDVAIATEHLCLAATSLGVATCWVCHFDTTLIRRAFTLPDDVEPIAIIPLGYPAEGTMAVEKKRKDIDEIVSWGCFKG